MPIPHHPEYQSIECTAFPMYPCCWTLPLAILQHLVVITTLEASHQLQWEEHMVVFVVRPFQGKCSFQMTPPVNPAPLK
jgi:hypothetical protein